MYLVGCDGGGGLKWQVLFLCSSPSFLVLPLIFADSQLCALLCSVLCSTPMAREFPEGPKQSGAPIFMHVGDHYHIQASTRARILRCFALVFELCPSFVAGFCLFALVFVYFSFLLLSFSQFAVVPGSEQAVFTSSRPGVSSLGLRVSSALNGTTLGEVRALRCSCVFAFFLLYDESQLLVLLIALPNFNCVAAIHARRLCAITPHDLQIS